MFESNVELILKVTFLCLTILANIGLGLKRLLVINKLAYYTKIQFTTVKSITINGLDEKVGSLRKDCF